MSIRINNRSIGSTKPVYFIADIASNHEGDIIKAKELVHACAEAKVDAVKMQNFTAETIVSQKGFEDLKGLKTHQTTWSSSVFDSYKAASIPLDWSYELSELTVKLGMHYFTTPYSPELVEAVSPYVCAYKVGSGDITWLDNLTKIAKQNKPILLATGASNIEDVCRAMDTLLDYNSEVLLMQCNTDYTANIHDNSTIKASRFSCINLAALDHFKKLWPEIAVGLSDHTHGHDTVLAAVALFECAAVEKHFTLDNSKNGQDHSFSMTPETWRKMVDETEELRQAVLVAEDDQEISQLLHDAMAEPEYLELMIGNGDKKIEANEVNTVQVQRRAIRAKFDIASGTKISEEMLDFLRPCPVGALAPYRKNDVIGKITNSLIKRGDLISSDNIQDE